MNEMNEMNHCHICGNEVFSSSSNIETLQVDLLYHGGNGKTRAYCTKCVIDATSLTEPKK